VAEQMPPFTELITAATASAVHLEMRDAYTPNDPDYLAWRAGQPAAALARSPAHQEWAALVRGLAGKGVRVRRARIVSEPLADFIRFEYQMTGPLNIAAGEKVRWLPRRQASDLALPGNDFWVLDDSIVRFSHFSGDGDYTGEDVTADPALTRFCTAAFEAVWERAIDHDRYQPAE
jgi:hypothetical protein